jgi:alpha/beta hydrolase fold
VEYSLARLLLAVQSQFEITARARETPWSVHRSVRADHPTPSGRCVDLRALAVGTERQRTQMSVEASPDSAAVPSSSFGPLRQIDAGRLAVGYAEAGPADGRAVILLHGWPDIHSYVDVAPLLAAEGYRVIVPHLRGYGTTRFLSDETFRNGEQAALALDVIALLDALEIESGILAGFDWVHGVPTSWRRFGPNAAAGWSPEAGT